MKKGWSIECLYDWKVYLKLAIPSLFSILIEYTYLEIGIIAAGKKKNFITNPLTKL